jgi:hypothetical protein
MRALRLLANADDPEAVRPPFVSDVTARYLGTGLKVLRYGERPARPGFLFAALNYAWRVDSEESDLRVFVSTPDLGRLQAAMADIDALTNVTRVLPP